MTDDQHAGEPIGEATSTELVPAGGVRHEVIRPLDVREQAEAMQLYQEGLKSILDSSDYQGTGTDRFVKKSGWRKIAAWMNLSVELVRDEVERDENGAPVRATVWARAIAPNGRAMDGDGHCSVDESRFSKTKGRQKLENDLRGTAATRATNRAISNLVGMGAVSAEEAEASAAPAQQGPAYGEPAGEALEQQLVRALAFLFDTGDGPDERLALEAYNRIGTDAGYVPRVVARSIGLAAGVLKQHLDAQPAAQDTAAAADVPADDGEDVPEAEVVG